MLTSDLARSASPLAKLATLLRGLTTNERRNRKDDDDDDDQDLPRPNATVPSRLPRFGFSLAQAC
ncbi:MAG: hypothetical protein U0271_35020 [Polyangiaceae bacterium]